MTIFLNVSLSQPFSRHCDYFSFSIINIGFITLFLVSELLFYKVLSYSVFYSHMALHFTVQTFCMIVNGSLLRFLILGILRFIGLVQKIQKFLFNLSRHL